MAQERTVVNPSVDGLKALSHPGRLRMLGLLRAEGPATATTLATRLGLNTGATSYHLRQLEKHGFVAEDTERGDRRDRWWRAAHTSTHTDSADLTTPEEHATYDAYLQAVWVQYSERQQRAFEERSVLPKEWRDVGDLSDFALTLTPERASALLVRLHEVIDTFGEDETPDAAPFVLNLNAYVRPGSVGAVEDES